MNKEELKNCFDAITPTDEQKEKMLARILKRKRKAFKFTPIYRYQTAFAAMIVVVLFLSIWPQLQHFGNNRAKEIYYDSGHNNAGKINSSYGDKNSEKYTEKEDNKNLQDTKDEAQVPTIGSENESKNNSYVSKEEGKPDNNENVESNDQDNGLALFEANEALGNEELENNADFVKDADDEDASMNSALDTGGEEKGYMTAMRALYSDLTYEEIMNDETYGKLFPRKILEGYEFVGAKSLESSLDADFKSENKSMHIRIYNKTDAEPLLVTITPDELFKYNKADKVSFSVLCDNYIVFYEIEGKDISEIYDMVVSSDYFNK